MWHAWFVSSTLDFIEHVCNVQILHYNPQFNVCRSLFYSVENLKLVMECPGFDRRPITDVKWSG